MSPARHNSAPLIRRHLRMAAATCCAAVLLVALTAAPAVSAAPTPAPAWFTTLTGNPTVFSPTPGFAEYTLNAINEGGAPTVGPFHLEITLPEGVEAVNAPPRSPEGKYGVFGGPSIPCEVVTARSVVCNVTGVQIGPGERAAVRIAVKVGAGAPVPLIARGEASGGGAPASAATTENSRGGSTAFGFLPKPAGLYSIATAANGSAATQAGETPFQLEVGSSFPTELVREVENANEAEFEPVGGGLRDLHVALPAGVVIDPRAAPTCTETELETAPTGEGVHATSCPPASQVGLLKVGIVFASEAGALAGYPVFNMVAPAGSPAVLAAGPILGTYIHFLGEVRSDGRYELAAAADNILAKLPIAGGRLSLWGVPADPAHNAVRGDCLFEGPGHSCPSEGSRAAFVRLPSACSGPLSVQATADSYLNSSLQVGESALSTDPAGNPVGIRGCSALSFEPSIAIEPEVPNADSPSGLNVVIHVPQTENPEALATANLKDVTVTLPPGVAVNPSAANGLAACSTTQIGYGPARAAAGDTGFSNEAPACPDASKLGSVEVITPLLDHPLPGSVYLAAPYDNPFDTLLALYVVVDDPQSGVILKLPGEVHADPASGQLTASFRENPQLPFEDLKLHFFGGPAAALKTPATCGAYASQSSLTPWSGTAPRQLTSAFPVTQGAGGSQCATAPAAQPNAPSFEAGSQSPIASAYTPFILKVSRADGSQNLRSINAVLPPGLTAKLAGVPYCPEGAIAIAAGKTGLAERANPSCAAASRVGKVTVAAGAGPRPFYVEGSAYLAGPYKGAPLSLAIITPAVAGPFDLGTVVVRIALLVNPITTQITAKSDPLPTILQGIPLDIRSVVVQTDRPKFTLNPTNCEPLATNAEAISVLGSAAPLSQRFQVAGCKSLKFSPKLALRVFGKTNRNAKPRFRAVLQTKPGEANIRRAQVNLPHSLFLEQGHIKTICTRVQFNAGAGHGEQCPKGSIYGHAKAYTPLLDQPLQGPVYLRSSNHKLPDLVAALNGQIDIALAGKVDSGPNAGIRNTFEVVPDAPVSKFILEMKGGKRGLLVNSENLCSKQAKATGIARFTGQNGKVETFKPKVANSCPTHRKPSKRNR